MRYFVFGIIVVMVGFVFARMALGVTLQAVPVESSYDAAGRVTATVDPASDGPSYAEATAGEGGTNELQMTDTKGGEEMSDDNHKGEIDILSTSNSATPKGETGESSDMNERGIEHDDIGVVNDDTDSAPLLKTLDAPLEAFEMTGKGMTKPDLVEELINVPKNLRAVFVKYGDIKGESSDSGLSGGNVETEFKVGKGEKAPSKPKEIVVVGSKVRGWDPKNKETIIGVAPSTASLVTDSDDLVLFAAKVVEEDELVEEVNFTYTKIEYDYKEQGTLFWIIPVDLTLRASVDIDGDEIGRIKVKFPWWSFMAGRKTVRPHDFQTALEKARDAGEFTVSHLENAEQKVAQQLQTTSNVMKAAHDTAMAVIRKIGG
jgi:hypothetical protein